MRYGYFDEEKREYVIERPDIPVSWTNYLGLEDMCTVLSHNSGGYSFYKSAEHGRITRFRPNGVPLDRPGHYLYLRDDESGDYWSASWQPVGKDLSEASYQVRHGLSYSKFSCEYSNIHLEKLMMIPLGEDVELWDVKITNTGDSVRQLSAFSYLEFSNHHIEIDNQNLQMSLYASGSSYQDAVIEFDFFYEPWTYHFFTANFEPDSYNSHRDSFIGNYRTETNPVAVENGSCDNRSELGGNHCGSLHKRITLQPGESKRLVFMLGVGSREEQGKRIRKKYSDMAQVDKAFDDLKKYWDTKTSQLQCRTPHQGLNTMMNTWNLYQAETCVVWSRFASFIEVGGRTGLGYRDTSQDILGVVHTNPEMSKQRILELLHAQSNQGYGIHLFDPDVFKPKEDKLPGVKLPTVVPSASPADIVHGIEDVCSDDSLWLVTTVCEYVSETGDLDFFNQRVPYADAGEDTVYGHLKRTLDFSTEYIGSNGICQGLRADWNDCLNLGGGQSAMVSFMHFWALQYFIDAARSLDKQDDVLKYSQIADTVKASCESTLWDGSWYIRGFTANGEKIGTNENPEGKVFLNAQSWAVVSGVASGERAELCTDAIENHLYSEYGNHLVWPAYTSPDDGVGYVTRVYPGIKENASIFSHSNPWAIIADCMLGNGDRAMKYYDAILPYNQNDKIETREAEPYSYCQFIMGEKHSAHGQARHPWLTGSASWFYVAVSQWILGVRTTFEGLVIDPCIPRDWDAFGLTRKWRGANFDIQVSNPDRVSKGIKELTLNGKLHHGSIPAMPEGSHNVVTVIMG
ncbi:MAG: N,N'-diacetylchitobiose phosphorylase [Candidatus Marinimicrobia bacterium]|nr:N,N'-diacetylchitobiose phosphorylase [FCB group bacterium]MBL7024931.1 N,N'-diacetylchitobiose phosphorylase [Candidatus Neomarinimicrobiota bacterium]